MNESTGLLIIGALVVMWVIQLFLTQRQLKAFYGRLKVLRQSGIVAVGKEGNRLGGRNYGVLCVDPDTRMIMHAEKLNGATVFAKLEPVAGLRGRPLVDLLEGKLTSGLPPKLAAAFMSAGRDIEGYLSKPKPEDEETAGSESEDTQEDGIPA